jgi:hypothetical protein
MIVIHYDFTDGTEVSYSEGKYLKDNFTTSSLEFFNFDEKTDEVLVLKRDGSFISRKNIQKKKSDLRTTSERCWLQGLLNLRGHEKTEKRKLRRRCLWR